MSLSAEINYASTVTNRRWPVTFWVGLAIILGCESLLFTDVAMSHRGPVHSNAQLAALPPPCYGLGEVARFCAQNMTPLVWAGLIFLLDGVLVRMNAADSHRRRPHHFWGLCVASIFIWCVFDLINFWIFYPRHAWIYIGVPPSFADRFWGYVLAFATVVPGMVMIGQVYTNLGWFDWARTRPGKMPAWLKALAFVAGLAMFAWPCIHRDPITNFTLWTSLAFLLDPINMALGRPSMLRDWENGWYGRTLAACAGGLTCGFLWEFWNYWALTKWTYHLPFLGQTEHVRYFEMPVVGLLGFIPFGIECWVMWQTMRIFLDGFVEPLPDERTLL